MEIICVLNQYMKKNVIELKETHLDCSMKNKFIFCKHIEIIMTYWEQQLAYPN